MELLDEIVEELKVARTPQTNQKVFLNAQKTNFANEEENTIEEKQDNASPSIEEILEDLQLNIDTTDDLVSSVNNYAVPLPEISYLKQETPEIKLFTNELEKHEETLSGSVIRMSSEQQCENSIGDQQKTNISKPQISPVEVQEYEEAKEKSIEISSIPEPFYKDETIPDIFNDELSSSFSAIRQRPSKLTKYICKEKQAPKLEEQEPEIEQRYDKGAEDIDALEKLRESSSKLSQKLKKSACTIIEPNKQEVAQNNEAYDFEEELNAITEPITAIEPYESYKQKEFEKIDIVVSINTILQASRQLVFSSDEMFTIIRKLDNEKIMEIEMHFEAVIKEPRLTRLMWKFLCEQDMAFEVDEFDAVELFEKMKAMFKTNFSTMGMKLADFVSCELEIDYEIVGVCLLLMMAQ